MQPAVNPTVSTDYKIDMKTAMIEAEMVMGGAVAEVLEKTGAPPPLPSRVLCVFGHRFWLRARLLWPAC